MSNSGSKTKETFTITGQTVINASILSISAVAGLGVLFDNVHLLQLGVVFAVTAVVWGIATAFYKDVQRSSRY